MAERTTHAPGSNLGGVSDLELRLEQVTRQRDAAWQLIEKILTALSLTHLSFNQRKIKRQVELEYAIARHQQYILVAHQICEEEQNQKLISPTPRAKLIDYWRSLAP